MATRVVTITQAKAELSELIDYALQGEEVIITRADKPLVRLVPWRPRTDRTPGAWKGRVRIAEDFDKVTTEDAADWYGDLP